MIKNLFKKIYRKIFCHKWQTRAVNRWGLPTYRVCLMCGKSQELHLPSFTDNWVDCDRIKEFDECYSECGKFTR